MHQTSELQLAVALLLAAVLSSVIGAEREYFAKAAGIRTYTLVGTGTALFTLVSQYGFFMSGASTTMGVDGARVAAQVVSGIGFLGAGVIFVRKDTVRGLTTAAAMWFVAAVGMTAAAGLSVLAITATCLYLLIMIGGRPVTARMPHSPSAVSDVTLTYLDGHGVLREIIHAIAKRGLKIIDLTVLDNGVSEGRRLQSVAIRLQGPSGTIGSVSADLAGLSGVEQVISDVGNGHGD